MAGLDVVAGGLVALVLGLAYAKTWWGQRGPEPGTTAHAKRLYATGEIDHAELARRLDVLEDPRADRIRQAAERVPNVGEETAWHLAAEFESLDEVREASVDRLEEVPNVGEARARALDRHL